MKVEQDGGILRCHSRKEESCSLEQNDLEVSVQLRGRASGEHHGAQLCPQSSQFKALPSVPSLFHSKHLLHTHQAQIQELGRHQ